VTFDVPVRFLTTLPDAAPVGLERIAFELPPWRPVTIDRFAGVVTTVEDAGGAADQRLMLEAGQEDRRDRHSG
jgi:hypothetical protein